MPERNHHNHHGALRHDNGGPDINFKHIFHKLFDQYTVADEHLDNLAADFVAGIKHDHERRADDEYRPLNDVFDYRPVDPPANQHDRISVYLGAGDYYATIDVHHLNYGWRQYNHGDPEYKHYAGIVNFFLDFECPHYDEQRAPNDKPLVVVTVKHGDFEHDYRVGDGDSIDITCDATADERTAPERWADDNPGAAYLFDRCAWWNAVLANAPGRDVA